RPLNLTAGDINGDGAPDIVVANYLSNTVSVLLNSGSPIILGGGSATGTISSALEAPATITVAAGNDQTATPNTAFATDLAVDVRDAGGTLVANVSVTFTAPASGPGGLFGGDISVTVVTDASGRAVAPSFVANAITGSYLV